MEPLQHRPPGRRRGLTPTASLIVFEQAVAAGELEAATTEAIKLLYAIDGASGALAAVDLGPGFGDAGEAARRRFATRFAAAFGELMCRPDLAMTPWTVEALFVFHRWIDILFALSGFESSAHFLARLTSRDGAQRGVRGEVLAQFLLLTSPSSKLGFDLDACFETNPGLTLVAALGYLGGRFCVTPEAGALRERLLRWAPGRLDRIKLGSLRLSYLPDVYMTCSYAFGAGKHAIKADLIAQARRALLEAGCREPTDAPPRRAKPRIVVVVERLHGGHSVYRTHFRALRSLRRRFEVIGVVSARFADADIAACFDDLIVYQGDEFIGRVRDAADRIAGLAPDIVFYLGVGMVGEAIALASMRFAPVQCASYGHGATTMSPAIDVFVAPATYFGDPSCFSERLLPLPAEAMPYARSAPSEPPPPPPPVFVHEDIVRIAVAASALKINATFLRALARIAEGAGRSVEFVFLPLGATGLAHDYLAREIRRVLPGSVVHAESPRRTYLERLGGCAFFLCPFPYGNMNSIVDAVVMGLPGVCLDGADLHAHADAAIFRQLGLPDALSASTEEEYVAQAVRLVDDAAWLGECREIVSRVDLEARLYAGDEALFCDALYDLLPAQ